MNGVITKGEVNAISELHDMSMSDDPVEATYGRMMKRLIPAVNAAIVAEVERNTKSGDIFTAAQYCSVSMLGSVSATLSGGKSMPEQMAKRVVASMVPLFLNCLSNFSHGTDAKKRPARRRK